MKRGLLIAVAVCMLLTVGCAGGESQQTPAASEAARTDGPDAMPRAASIPTLEFVAVSDLAKGTKSKPGTLLDSKSYKPAMTGKSITSVQWIVGEAEGLRRMMLSLTFDPDSRRKLEGLIMTHTDENLLVVLDGKVVGRMAIYESVSEGSLTLGSPEMAKARAEIDAATVPSN